MERTIPLPRVTLGSSWRGLTDLDELWVVTDIEAIGHGRRVYAVTCAGGTRAGAQARFPDVDMARLAEVTHGPDGPFLLRPEETVGQLHAQRRRALGAGRSFEIPSEVRRILSTYVGPDCCPADLCVVGERAADSPAARPAAAA